MLRLFFFHQLPCRHQFFLKLIFDLLHHNTVCKCNQMAAKRSIMPFKAFTGTRLVQKFILCLIIKQKRDLILPPGRTGHLSFCRIDSAGIFLRRQMCTDFLLLLLWHMAHNHYLPKDDSQLLTHKVLSR